MSKSKRKSVATIVMLEMPRRAVKKPMSIKPFEDQMPKLECIAAAEDVAVVDVMRSSFDMAIRAYEQGGRIEITAQCPSWLPSKRETLLMGVEHAI